MSKIFTDLKKRKRQIHGFPGCVIQNKILRQKLNMTLKIDCEISVEKTCQIAEVSRSGTFDQERQTKNDAFLFLDCVGLVDAIFN